MCIAAAESALNIETMALIRSMWLGPKVPRRGVGAAKGNHAAVEISTGELRRELTVSEWWKWIRDVLAETLRDVSALASLIGVDCRLDRSFRLKTGSRVFGLGVALAPIAQFVGIALEMRMHVTRHQFVAPLRRRPVRPVVRQQ